MNSVKTPFAQGYAPEGFARIYNNFTSTPAKLNVPGTDVDLVDTVAKAAHATTAFKLGLSGYHTLLETQEAIFSGMSNAIDKIAGGRPLEGIATFVRSPVDPSDPSPGAACSRAAILTGISGGPR